MADEKNMRKRRWFITVMNPDEHELARDDLIALLIGLSPLYFCFGYETAPTTGTKHLHCLLCFENARSFSSLKSKLPTANIQAVLGKASECVAYIHKGEENGSAVDFYEYGEPPTEREKSAATPKSFQIIEAIKAGATDLEILETIPGAVYQTRNLETVRQMIQKEEYGNKLRDLTVTFCYGPTGTGKTRYAYAQAENPSNLARITNYKRGLMFDSYEHQDILCLDEFSSVHVPIGELLTLTDIYPVQLPARYADKTACFTRVFILSNLRLDEHYKYEQIHQRTVWRALLRRITSVLEFQPDYSIIDRTSQYKEEISND